MERIADILGKWIIARRWWVIIGTVIAVLLLATGLKNLSFTNDSRIFFSAENPQLKALEALENTYNKEDDLLFVVAPRDGNVFTRKTLTAIEKFTEACWQIPHSSRVDSLTNFQHTRGEADELVVADLVPENLELTAENLARIRAISLAEPLLVNRLLSPAGDVTGISILVIKPGKSIDETSAIAGYARQLAADFRRDNPGIDMYLTGGIMIDNAFGEASREDMSTLVPAMYLILFLILALSLRSISGTLSTLLVVVFSLLSALGLTGWLGIILSPTTVNAPTIILTLAVADSVHILITMFHLMRQGRSKNEAILESLQINLQPVIITSLTTAIGFLSMNFSDAPPFRELGNIVAMGVVAALFYSVFLLPALIAVLPVRIKMTGNEDSGCTVCDRLSEFIIRRQTALFWSLIAVIVLMTAGMLKIDLDDDFVKYFDHRYDFRTATDFAQDRLTGFNVIEYSLAAPGEGAVNEPAYLAVVDDFAKWYRQQEKVGHVYAVTDIIKRLNQNMHADDPAFFRIPESRELAAQYLLLYEMSLPFGLDLNNVINVDKSSSRFVVRVKDMSSTEIRQMDDKARAWLAANAPSSMFTYGSGLSVMFAHISERNIRSMLVASFGALGIISLLLIVVFKSFKIGLASLLPNLTPAMMAFGLWGYCVGRVGLVVSVLAALTLGIVVDDTIHFLSKYLWARRKYEKSPADAVRYAFHTVGTAMWVTTVVLVAGFMILAFSGFKLNSDMGLMTALTICIALAMDFLFLPTLLLKIDKTMKP